MFKEINDKNIIKNKDNKNNLLIEGDNIYSLEFLKEKYTKKIGLIYIDPPYNTGSKKFKYKDRLSHHEWSKMMKDRLLIAKELLSEDGIIFLSIDEYEFAQLKLVCDEVFEEKNFVENFIWIKNSTKNNSGTTSTNHEYILCYAKDIKKIKKKGYFQIEKEGFEEITKIRTQYLKNKKTEEELQEYIREYYNKNTNLKGISMYKYVEKNTYDIYRISDISSPGGDGEFYDVLHPLTKKSCKKPAGGWRFKKETMDDLIKDGKIYFGEDENTVPQVKRYLKDFKTEISKSIITNFEEGENTLRKVLNVKKAPFNNPKPVSLINTLINFHPKKDILVLDFFAGSGTTGQSVLECNMKDGGNRKFILCTNNENNICEEITHKRIKTIINGIREDNTKYGKGYTENLIYYKYIEEK